MMPALRRLALGFPIDWSHRRAYGFPSSSSGDLGTYYVEWDPREGIFGEDWDKARRDENGVICDGPGYHAIRISQYALHLYGRWSREADAQAREGFLQHAVWLRDAQQRCGEIEGMYCFGFPWTKYGAGSGWRSAMAQGEAISVLLRAAQLAPGSGFDSAAARAAEPFKRAIEHGGVVWRDDRNAFFEEVANEHAAHILNGCIFAFWGLWELHCRRNEPWEATLLERVSTTLQKWLPVYDTGWWSRYSLLRAASGRPHVATLKYHAFHIAQLRVLGAMLNESRFVTVADRWENYIDDPRSRRRVVFDAAVSLYDRARAFDTIARGARAEVA
jgi:hypothetical protein